MIWRPAVQLKQGFNPTCSASTGQLGNSLFPVLGLSSSRFQSNQYNQCRYFPRPAIRCGTLFWWKFSEPRLVMKIRNKINGICRVWVSSCRSNPLLKSAAACQRYINLQTVKFIIVGSGPAREQWFRLRLSLLCASFLTYSTLRFLGNPPQILPTVPANKFCNAKNGVAPPVSFR